MPVSVKFKSKSSKKVIASGPTAEELEAQRIKEEEELRIRQEEEQKRLVEEEEKRRVVEEQQARAALVVQTGARGALARKTAAAERARIEAEVAEAARQRAEEERLRKLKEEEIRRQHAILTVQAGIRAAPDHKRIAQLRAEAEALRREAASLAVQRGTRCRIARKKVAEKRLIETQKASYELGRLTASAVVNDRARTGGVFLATAHLMFHTGQGVEKKDYINPPESARRLIEQGMQARLMGKAVKARDEADDLAATGASS